MNRRDERLAVRIATLRPEDAGRGVVRLPAKARAFAIEPGTIVELAGPAKSTVARASEPYLGDGDLQIVRMDGITRTNCGCVTGDLIQVRAVMSLPAERILLCPEKGVLSMDGSANRFRSKLLERPLASNDLIDTVGHFEVRDLPGHVRAFVTGRAYSPKDIRIRVLETVPEGYVTIDENTEFTWLADSTFADQFDNYPEELRQAHAGLNFTLAAEGIVDLGATTGTSRLLRDQEARDRHFELCRLLVALLDSVEGSNSAVSLGPKVQALLDALGELSVDVRSHSSLPRPGLIITRGDALRHELAVCPADPEGRALAPTVFLALRAAVRAYNAFVRLDPYLAERDRALGISAGVPITFDDRESFVRSAQAAGIATPRAIASLLEEVWLLGVRPGPNAQARTGDESLRNFAKRVLRTIWLHKAKISAGLAVTTVGLYQVGRWALANEEIILKLLSDNPAAASVVSKLLQFLHTMPLM